MVTSPPKKMDKNTVPRIVNIAMMYASQLLTHALLVTHNQLKDKKLLQLSKGVLKKLSLRNNRGGVRSFNLNIALIKYFKINNDYEFSTNNVEM